MWCLETESRGYVATWSQPEQIAYAFTKGWIPPCAGMTYLRPPLSSHSSSPTRGQALAGIQGLLLVNTSEIHFRCTRALTGVIQGAHPLAPPSATRQRTRLAWGAHVHASAGWPHPPECTGTRAEMALCSV